MRMRWVVFISAFVEAAMVGWALLVHPNHDTCTPYGIWTVDNVVIPVGAIALVVLIISGILQMFEMVHPGDSRESAK